MLYNFGHINCYDSVMGNNFRMWTISRKTFPGEVAKIIFWMKDSSCTENNKWEGTIPSFGDWSPSDDKVNQALFESNKIVSS